MLVILAQAFQTALTQTYLTNLSKLQSGLKRVITQYVLTIHVFLRPYPLLPSRTLAHNA